MRLIGPVVVVIYWPKDRQKSDIRYFESKIQFRNSFHNKISANIDR